VFPANDLGRVAGRTLQQVGPLCEHLIPYRPIHLGEDLCVDQPHASPLVKVLQRSQAVRPLPEERVPALGTALQEPDAPALGQISNRQLQFRSVRIRRSQLRTVSGLSASPSCGRWSWAGRRRTIFCRSSSKCARASGRSAAGPATSQATAYQPAASSKLGQALCV